MENEKLREVVARLLCRQHGGDPDAVASEPHDCWDGPLWTAFTTDADEIIVATRAPADCKLADNDGKNCVLLEDHEGSCLSYDPKEVGVRLMSALGHVENCRAHGRVTDAGFAAIRSALLIADRELSRLRAPADLRSALEAETIERCAKVAEDFEGSAALERCDDPSSAIACEIADLIRALGRARAIRALAPTKGDVS